jgi:hypothetical protein
VGENVLIFKAGICSMESGILLVLREVFEHGEDKLIKHEEV